MIMTVDAMKLFLDHQLVRSCFKLKLKATVVYVSFLHYLAVWFTLKLDHEVVPLIIILRHYQHRILTTIFRRRWLCLTTDRLMYYDLLLLLLSTIIL